MTLKTRKPTGLPSWPIVLLAGPEGTGKSWAAASASASELVGRTLWIGIGEDDPDEYGIIPGADFEIVEHAGSYPAILQAVRDAAAEPATDGKPNLIVLDSGTRLWNLIGDNAQEAANRRAKGKKTADGDYTISMDLWNIAAGQWRDVIDVLQKHQGPSIITARLDEVVVMNDEGQPTKERTWKIQGHKSLPFDASVVVQMRARGEYLVTKAKSARHPLEKATPFPNFTVEEMWKRLGLAEVEAGARTHSTVVSDDGAERRQFAAFVSAIGKQTDVEILRAMYAHAVSQNWLGLEIDSTGQTVEGLLTERRQEIERPPEAAPAVASEPRELEEVEAEREAVYEEQQAAAAEPTIAWPWDREQTNAFLLRVQAAPDFATLQPLAHEAMSAGVMGMPVDQAGTTIEYLLSERKFAIENPKAEMPAEPEPGVGPGSDSVPMALDVEGTS